MVQFEIENAEVIAQRVASGALGLPLVEGPLEDDCFEMRTVRLDQLVLVTSPDHPFTAVKRVCLHDLADQP